MAAYTVANELSSSAGTDMDRLDIECLDIVIAPLAVVLCDDWLEAFFRRDFLCAPSFVALRCSCYRIGQYLFSTGFAFVVVFPALFRFSGSVFGIGIVSLASSRLSGRIFRTLLRIRTGIK